MKRSVCAAWVLAGAVVASGIPVWADEAEVANESALPSETTMTPVANESALPSETTTPAESAEPGSERRDLYLDMPYYLGGFDPDIVMTRGEEHFANLEAGDQARVRLERLLDEVGAEVGDMVSGYALVSQEDFFSFVVAIRVEGVEPGTLLPAYLPILYEDLIEPEGMAGNIGGKDVVIISSVGSDDEFVELFVYDQGDTLWMVQGPEDVIDITLDNLPLPISAD